MNSQNNNDNNNNQSQQNNDSDIWDQIRQTGTVTPDGGKHCIHCLTIIGQIEGHGVLPSDTKTTK